MKNKHKNERGVITVLVSLLLTGILSLGTMVIEAGRLQAARTQLDDATQSAAMSDIARYDSDLFDRFGLLSMDYEEMSMGTYWEYLDFNSDNTYGYEGGKLATLYDISYSSRTPMGELSNPAVLKRQILYRAKYNIIPQDFALNYYNAEHILSGMQDEADYIINSLAQVTSGEAAMGTTADISSDMLSALAALYSTLCSAKSYDEDYNVTISSDDFDILPSYLGTAGNSHPEDITAINDVIRDAIMVIGSDGSLLESNNGVGYEETFVRLDTSFASDTINDLSDLSSLPLQAANITSQCAWMISDIRSAITALKGDMESNLLLNSYIAKYFPNKNNPIDSYYGCAKGSAVSGVSNAAFAGACVEYVFDGNESELINQQNAYYYVVATRLLGNLYSVVANSPSFDQTNATNVAAHVAWAYYETLIDAQLLFKYNATVPINKYKMILPIDDAAAVKDAFASRDLVEAMKVLGIYADGKFTVDGYDNTNYRDALALGLWFVPNYFKINRVADLVQLEMRYREQHVNSENATFLMTRQYTICRVKTIASLNSVLPVLSLNSGTNVNGTVVQSIKYVGY